MILCFLNHCQESLVDATPNDVIVVVVVCVLRPPTRPGGPRPFEVDVQCPDVVDQHYSDAQFNCSDK
jgi:hypothetical protein